MIRRPFVAIFALAAFITVAALPIAARQTPTQTRDTRQPVNAAPAIVGTGALGGAVTNDDGSRPVRNAYVVLIGTGKGVVKVTSTDSDGKFMFTALPADRYTVGVSKPPYLGTVAGARRPARSGTPIALADTQKISNIAIRMPLGAAITGVVTDEKSQSAANVQMALYQWRMQSGVRTLVSSGTGVTDDRGRYRFFGLIGGDYVVAAWRPGTPTSGRVLGAAEVDAALRGNPVTPAPVSPTNVRYAPVFFPGTTRSSEAMSISVATGEERPNVDIRLETVVAVRVEGAVTSSDGQALAPGTVTLSTVGTNLLQSVANARFMPDGRFVFMNVVPGTYGVRVIGAGPQAGQFALATIEVSGADVFGVQVSMQPALSFAGSLVFRGAALAPAIAGRRVPLRSLSAGTTGALSPSVSTTTQTGAFTVTNVFPGSYIIGGPLGFGPNTDTMTWALESVIVDGRDVTDLPININADTLPKDVVVTYSDRFQELTGRITRSTGVPASEHTIIVFPEDKAYWISGSRRILTTRPGTDGRFTLSGAGPTTLPPGNYLLAAVTDIDRDEQFDPAFLSALIPATISITLQPGDKKVQDLVIK